MARLRRRDDEVRRSTRARRTRTQTPLSAAEDEYEEKPRRSARRSRTPRTRRADDEDEDEDEDDHGADAYANADDGDGDGDGDGGEEGEGDADIAGGDGEGDDDTEYRVEDDAFVLDTDPAGEAKVDHDGHLQGGRSYHIQTMVLPERSERRLYMLSIDVARGLGFRDSGYFFRKNPLIHKVSLTLEEKDQLVSEGRISSGLRARNVTAVTARNAFQVIGARLISRGRHVTDDYYEAQARADGKREGTLATQPSMHMDRRRDLDRDRDRGKRGADAATYTTVDPHGNLVTTTFGDAGHAPFDRTSHLAQRRQILLRADMTEENWMAMYAQSVRTANADMLSSRRDRLLAFPSSHAAAPLGEHVLCDTRPPWEKDEAPISEAARAHARREREPPLGLYDPHTHTAFFSTDTQPRAAWFAKVDDAPHGLPANARLAQLYTVETRIMMR